ncbi:MAG: Rrf2 family transcriptional regulator [Candidatus Abyssobacteria bacterium SURF_17]|uniref:Rrf2 family transcriptional regulator n=1 Tax=Candidatus Abyssobacteria bacterium SURF_17 TaxID=2093361 RepID=A0A419F847_9BACT|nr:MAG: Rrf2 family transcriptional regulator [Candidatus Abyssubacteria bacterium SURF_17]
MEISKASVTAIHGLAYLADNSDRSPVDVSVIAKELGVSQGYLAKIFQRIARSHMVYSRRGPQGGYLLASEPEKISLLDIVEAIDGPVVTGRCELGPGEQCRLFQRCKIRRQLDKIKEQTRELYRSITLDMFSRQFKRA